MQASIFNALTFRRFLSFTLYDLKIRIYGSDWKLMYPICYLAPPWGENALFINTHKTGEANKTNEQKNG